MEQNTAQTAHLKTHFFSQDKNFYRSLFSMLVVVAMQNLISYSVNMADNIMLGHYSQQALSGAALVNQIFFMVNQLTVAVGDSLIVISSQYWGQKRTEPVRRIAGTVLRIAFCVGIVIIVLCTVFSRQLLGIFTTDPEILDQGEKYLAIIKYTFLLLLLTQVLLATLRSVETVKIAFYISCVSLVINVCVNSTLIFGRFGFPELGIVGAAAGTIISRFVELLIVVVFLLKKDKKLRLFAEGFPPAADAALRSDYVRVAIPIITASMLWAVSVPLQTAILGHLSSDAIAANSVATTFYQYMKVIVMAMSSTSAVMMGKTVGKGDLEEVKAAGRTLSVIDVCIGLVLGSILFFSRGALLSYYKLNETAAILADQLIVIMAAVMVGMSYQMPVGSGIIRGSGDTKFSLYLNMISTWGIVMPLSFAAAFLWKWPIPAVVLCLQSDQIFKGLPIFLRFRSYKWIHRLTR